MKFATKSLVAGAIVAAGIALSATSASAYVACNAEGECWRVHRHTQYNYNPSFGIVVHPDNWRWSSTDHYRWHNHAGRGYWRNGAWVRF